MQGQEHTDTAFNIQKVFFLDLVFCTARKEVIYFFIYIYVRSTTCHKYKEKWQLIVLVLILTLVVTELDSKAKSKLGKLLHVVKVDVRNIIVCRMDVRAYHNIYNKNKKQKQQPLTSGSIHHHHAEQGNKHTQKKVGCSFPPPLSLALFLAML